VEQVTGQKKKEEKKKEIKKKKCAPIGISGYDQMKVEPSTIMHFEIANL